MFAAPGAANDMTTMAYPLDPTFSVAPMMACTDRHARFFLRLLSKRALLYTEMITAAALVYGKRYELLDYDTSEHPVAVQFGGNEPAHLAHAAREATVRGYDEINLNVGCPSERVQSGCFGAALMAEPETVARCVEAMAAVTDVPVTVKTRIGIDDRDSYEHLHEFISTVAAAGCELFIIHARKAWLSGLSPKENREIPPLRYDVAARVKADFPNLKIVLNGGITEIAECQRHLTEFDGVMLGREPYKHPYLLATVDRDLFGETGAIPKRDDVVSAYLPYVERELASGVALRHMSRHIVGLFQGQPGAKRWRQRLSIGQCQSGAGIDVIHEALAEMQAAAHESERRGNEWIANHPTRLSASIS